MVVPNNSNLFPRHPDRYWEETLNARPRILGVGRQDAEGKKRPKRARARPPIAHLSSRSRVFGIPPSRPLKISFPGNSPSPGGQQGQPASREFGPPGSASAMKGPQG